MAYLGSVFSNPEKISIIRLDYRKDTSLYFMKKYPKLKFNIDSNKEIEIYFSFLRDGKYRNLDREMKWAFYNPHPKLKILKNKNLSRSKRKKIIQDYVNNYYKKHLSEIRDNTLLIEKQWMKLERKFFTLVDKIFKNYPWPNGKYIAYPTIWGMYPRDIKNKILWFPFRYKTINYPIMVIAHEMLHFIFYNYLYNNNFRKYKTHKYDFKIWNISEAFNIIIQNSPEWLKVFKEKCKLYPEHKKLIQKMKKIWQEKQNIDYLLKKILPK